MSRTKIDRMGVIRKVLGRGRFAGWARRTSSRDRRDWTRRSVGGRATAGCRKRFSFALWSSWAGCTPSVITSKPATNDHFKTGHHGVTETVFV
jgi:hypothetical protein